MFKVDPVNTCFSTDMEAKDEKYYENLFTSRYTDDDEDYLKTPVTWTPPCVENLFNQRNQYDRLHLQCWLLLVFIATVLCSPSVGDVEIVTV